MRRATTDSYLTELEQLRQTSNLRALPSVSHDGKYIISSGRKMLNTSSNDYLGLAASTELREKFLSAIDPSGFIPSSSSSRLLTGNFREYTELEGLMADLAGREACLVFNSGYHANIGILPAVSDQNTLILADKLVHASIIDGIRLCQCPCIRYRHNNYEQLERLVRENHPKYSRIIIVTESIFSMDGDEADLPRLVSLRNEFDNVMLYVDEAHAFGVRGKGGFGCSEEYGVIKDIDFLVGTFGKAAASAGAYILCDSIIREYLVNKMRPLIFTTALPPITLKWTKFIVGSLESFSDRRIKLENISSKLRDAAAKAGYAMPSTSHIIPLITGESSLAVEKALRLQECGFYALPVRPPTVPQGSSRIRLSLSAFLEEEDIDNLIAHL